MADPKIYPKRFEILDANDNTCRFRINIDVLNECFGANRKMYMHACYPQGNSKFIPGTKPGEKFMVWMPKLYGNSSEWKNSISEDNNTIYEVAETTRHADWMDTDKHDLNAIRLVFVKPSPSLPYVFKGVYINDQMDFLHHSYRRIATRVRLIGDPVTRIELLESIEIPDNEEEQYKQAATLTIDQLREIAKRHSADNPEQREVTTKQYKRSPYIAELAKREANGICQLCGMDAPFITNEGRPYLETHHIVWLSAGGADTIENTVAVCPNCHKRLHILNDIEDVEFLKTLKE